MYSYGITVRFIVAKPKNYVTHLDAADKETLNCGFLKIGYACAERIRVWLVPLHSLNLNSTSVKKMPTGSALSSVRSVRGHPRFSNTDRVPSPPARQPSKLTWVSDAYPLHYRIQVKIQVVEYKLKEVIIQSLPLFGILRYRLWPWLHCISEAWLSF